MTLGRLVTSLTVQLRVPQRHANVVQQPRQRPQLQDGVLKKHKHLSALRLTHTHTPMDAPIRLFSIGIATDTDQLSVRRDRSKSHIVLILFCVIVKPHKRHKNIIKHHKVLVHRMRISYDRTEQERLLII